MIRYASKQMTRQEKNNAASCGHAGSAPEMCARRKAVRFALLAATALCLSLPLSAHAAGNVPLPPGADMPSDAPVPETIDSAPPSSADDPAAMVTPEPAPTDTAATPEIPLPVTETDMPAPPSVPELADVPPAPPPVSALTPVPDMPAAEPAPEPVAAPAPDQPEAAPEAPAEKSVRRTPPPPPGGITDEAVVEEFYDSATVATPDNKPTLAIPKDTPASRVVTVTRSPQADEMDRNVTAADRAMQLGRYEAALDFYDRLIKQNPIDPRLLLGRAIALHKLKRVEPASVAYEDVLSRDPDNTTAIVNLTGLLRQEFPAVALQRLSALWEKNGDNPTIAAQLGILYGDQERFEDAYKFLSIASSLAPENPQHFFNMGIIAERMNDKTAAIKNYEQALHFDAVGGADSVPRETIYDRLSVLRRAGG